MPDPPELRNIEKSLDCNLLWPPVADALSAFVRRRAARGDGYELTWRLIHVWEAAATVLSSAATSRLRELGEPGSDAYLRCREHLHGRKMDPVSGLIKRSQGALDGSANRRIEMLISIRSFEGNGSRFLTSLRSFLELGGLQIRPLVSSWQQICDVPPEIIGADTVKVWEAFKHVNSFRNRFAHVPFPYDEIGQIAERLAILTDELFSLEPNMWTVFRDESLENPLTGAISFQGRFLRGSAPPRIHSNSAIEPQFVFPGSPNKPVPHVEIWNAAPFIFVDSMFRPSTLTRLLSESDGIWEYTRFLAERNSIVRVPRPDYGQLLIKPSEADYPDSASEDQEDEQVLTSIGISEKNQVTQVGSDGEPQPVSANLTIEFNRALRSLANDDFDTAITIFRSLTQDQPNYHVGWLRLGYALREKAMRLRFENPDQAKILLEESINALTSACGHRAPHWQAQALYERSKSKFHLSQRLPNHDDSAVELKDALADAESAYLKSREPKYASWIEHIAQHGFGVSIQAADGVVTTTGDNPGA